MPRVWNLPHLSTASDASLRRPHRTPHRHDDGRFASVTRHHVSSVKSRGEYKSAANASLTMRELEQWLTLQIVEVYHQREHRAIGMPPLAAWTRSLADPMNAV